jgi:hypothetical protein
VAVEFVNFEMMIHVVVSDSMLLCSDEDVVWGCVAAEQSVVVGIIHLDSFAGHEVEVEEFAVESAGEFVSVDNDDDSFCR